MKIGDLFVRLGLKKDELTQGLQTAEKQVSAFSKNMKILGSALAGIGIAAALAIGKAAAEAIKSSQQIGDKWGATMTGMKAAFKSFTQALVNWDWKGLGDRISNVFKAGKETYAAKDAETEIMNSLKIRKAAMAEELNALQIQARNQKLSYAERAKAAQEYLDKVRPLYEEETAMRENTRVAQMNQYLAGAGLSAGTGNRDLLQTFLTDVAPDSALTQALYQYAKKTSGREYTLTAEQTAMIDRIFETYGYGGGGAMASLAEYYQRSSDKDASAVVDAIAAAFEARGAFDEETRRIQNILNTAEAQIDTTVTAVEQTGTDWAEQARQAASAAAEIAAADAEVAAMGDAAVAAWEAANDVVPRDLTDLFEMGGRAAAEAADNMDKYTASLEKAAEEEKKLQEASKELAEAFNQSVAAGISDGLQTIMDGVFGLQDINGGAVIAALLTPLADLAVREGEILVATGTGIEALKTSLSDLEGVGAIIAGGALIAIGAAAKAGLRSLAQSGTASASSVTAAAATGGEIAATEGRLAIDITVNGRLSGDDIVISGARTEQNWGR